MPSATPSPPARPLTARSVLLSLLLGNTPPRSSVARLVRTASLFGIAEGTARTALSRMANAGEVTADDGWYELTSDRLLARQSRQQQSRRAETTPWDGSSWLQAVVAATSRRHANERAQLRERLGVSRLAELREGVWMRPDNLATRFHDGATGDGTDTETLIWFDVRADGRAGRDLAGRLWDLPAWATRADELAERMRQLVGPLDDHDSGVLADGFVTSADVLRHFQADPLLPAALLPDHWPGAELRETYDRYDHAYRVCLARWFDVEA